MSSNLQLKKNIIFRINERMQRDGFSATIKAAFIHSWSLFHSRIFLDVVGLLAWPLCFILNIKFLNVLVSRIGHLCVEPDCYLKEEILGEHPKFKALILAPRGSVANEHILSYWKPYIKFISSPLLCAILKPLTNNRFTTYNILRYANVINYAADYPRIQARYNKSGRGALLALTDLDICRGRDLLQKLGMPRDAWFVCVHCREEGYISGEGQTYRNADITSYLPAIEAIIERGGWVVRLGDPSMKKFPTNKYIIDYAHSDDKSDWADVFLGAACKFFLGSASGLSGISHVFGIPSAITNQAPISVVLPYLSKDLGIPKLFYSQAEGRYLNFVELFGSSIGNFRFDSLYKEAGICVIDNTSEDIKELAMEMLDRIDSRIDYTAEDDILQNNFKLLMNSNHYSCNSPARVGRAFLKKYSFLLSG